MTILTELTIAPMLSIHGFKNTLVLILSCAHMPDHLCEYLFGGIEGTVSPGK
jgi:hypothetical protein